ncbi:unnamed protein product, partial [Mesorhabditis belari]|uniref:MD-2-related lipid-recognition domain-containing protein n=1 Tax=Mesorhabditis belari TaxID=2138241 RepID=A0AAF3FIE9_9BILA
MGALETIKFRDCKSTFKVDRVAVDGARVDSKDGKQILIFKADSNPKMQITFTPNADVSSEMGTAVNAKMDTGLFKWSLPDANACSFMTCPLKNGVSTTYEQSFHLKAEYPKDQTIQVNWVIQKAGGDTKENCKSNFKVISLEIAGAEMIEENGHHITLLKKGTHPKIRIRFEPDVNLSNLKTEVNAKMDGALLRWNMPETNACKFMDCPLVEGEETVYEQSIQIKSEYPTGKTIQVNWVIDGDRQDIHHDICIIFLARIQH